MSYVREGIVLVKQSPVIPTSRFAEQCEGKGKVKGRKTMQRRGTQQMYETLLGGKQAWTPNI